MVELLSRHTRMKVVQAEEDAVLQPNTVFLIPPKKIMTVEEGRLHLMERTNKPIPYFPIDTFLNSLAEDKGERSIAMILSGTGSDGTRGIRAIKDWGGMVMVQDLASSKFDGMPRNAIDTGLADYVVDPENMPDELLKYIQHPFTSEEKVEVREDEEYERQFKTVFSLLKNHSGVDFTYYKQSTVLRRIKRRLSINQIETLGDYVKYLHQNPDEVETLYKELLIGVTRFFRDPESYEVLKKKVLPEIFKNNTGVIRAWIGGCSTGEEAYSVAMLFREYMDETGDYKAVKIFATDIDKESLEFASVGKYPENIAADLTPARLQKFFVKKGDVYQVSKPLREMVIFAVHNILKDPPFNKIDLLCCRNLLIYLQPKLQHDVLSFFNFALKEDGFLFLGSSETVGGYANLFSPFDNKWRIYRCRGRYVPLPQDGFKISPVHMRRSAPDVVGQTAEVETKANKKVDNAVEALMERYIPPAVIIDEKMRLLHVLGNVNKFVKFKPGKTSLNISGLVREDLSMAVETAVNRVLRENSETVYNDVKIEGEDRPAYIDIIATPYEQNGERVVMVVFEEAEARTTPQEDVEKYEHDSHAQQRIKDLENELQYTKENLQATIEEVETTNEELQATNEELLSANEELQSTNEELQSVNEELITVNAEYQSKIQELSDLNNDMNNLLSSTNIGVIFLDNDLRVRKFTPAVKEQVHLMDFDIGRPITHISVNLEYDELEKDCRTVLKSFVPIKKEVRGRGGKVYYMRIFPYVTQDKSIKGVVLTFVDISEIKEAQAEIQKLSATVELSPSMISILDTQGRHEYINRSMAEHTGYGKDEMLGKSFKSIIRNPERVVDDIWKKIENGDEWAGYYKVRCKNGKVFDEYATLVPIRNEDGEIFNFFKIAWDVSDRIEEREKRRREHEMFQKITETSPVPITVLDSDGNVVFANKHAEELFGLSREEITSRTYNDAPWVIQDPKGNPFPEEKLPFVRVKKTQKPVYNIRHSIARDGERLQLLIHASPLFDAEGNFDGAVSAIEDVTRILEYESRLGIEEDSRDDGSKETKNSGDK
jgi:two-component system CheB/CheR fusion protein